MPCAWCDAASAVSLPVPQCPGNGWQTGQRGSAPAGRCGRTAAAQSREEITMRAMTRTPTWPVWAIASLCVAVAPARSQQGAPATIPVGTVLAEKQPISKALDFVGRIDAINRVEIRARVKGYLEAVLFKEGDLVKEGDPLYRIEKGLFEAAVEEAAGALERAKAALTLAELQRKRAEDLLAKASGTVVARDQAVAE